MDINQHNVTKVEMRSEVLYLSSGSKCETLKIIITGETWDGKEIENSLTIFGKHDTKIKLLKTSNENLKDKSKHIINRLWRSINPNK